MNTPELAEAVQQLADLMHGLNDHELDRAYTWRYHDEGLRFVLIGTYHELRTLAADLAAERATSGSPLTLAQRVLGQYHSAYRDLQAILIGVGDAAARQPPAPDEWPITVCLCHMHDTARQFFGRIWYAVEQQRNGNSSSEMSNDELIAFVGEALSPAAAELRVDEVRVRFDALHERIIAELAGIGDHEIDTPSLWWENENIPVRYRLHRFDAHLRQHSIQIEKTLGAIGHAPNESKRLLRLIYQALADVEAQQIGAPAFGSHLVQASAESLMQRIDGM